MSEQKFLVFAGSDYYPLGGWDDFHGAYATREEAIKAARPLRRPFGWVHVVDLETGAKLYVSVSVQGTNGGVQ